MSEINLFVDRERELSVLESYYEQCRSFGSNCGVLIYGWRRVGKTTLLKRFVEIKGGFLIEVGWLSDVRSLLLHVSRLLNKKELHSKILEEEAFIDPMILLREALKALCYEGGFKVVVLDEFHIMLDKFSYRIARETRKRKEVVLSDLSWLLREFIESRKCFWVLSTSMGWAKVKEIYLREDRKAQPLTGVLVRMEVKPLDRDSSIELAKKLNNELDNESAEKIYRLSGGVPRIIELIAPQVRGTKSILKLAYELASQGQFDEFFENIIRFVAESTKRDYSVYLEILKSIEDNEITPEEAARKIDVDRVSAYNILEELRKMGLLEKNKEKGRVRYKLTYPLLSLWLQTRISPGKSIVEILASRLGIMAESYVRELLGEYKNRKERIELYDDERGTYLAGTTEKLAIEIDEIYSKEKTKTILKDTENADIIIRDKNGEEWIIEVKATIKDISPKTIEKLNKVASKAGIKNKLLILVGTGNISLKAATTATKTNTIIITNEGLKMLAKKIGFMQY